MNELSQTRAAMAVLFVALVKALNEKNEGLTHSFLKHLDEAASDIKESGVDPALSEILAWTRESLQSDEDLGQPAWVVYGKAWGHEQVLPSSEQVEMVTLLEALGFWTKLPEHERRIATIETASGRRFDAAAIGKLLKVYKHDLTS
ncbi:MAG: hypothetical protein P4L76_05220 [Beijerinckiaceae bacterium]|nr:hypothetical protein [Beijerinckiaceae bacterium]